MPTPTKQNHKTQIPRTMPKRKLSELTPQPREASRATRLAENFDQGVQTLSRALRTARGFERQKLGRREQKAKSEKNHNLLDRVGEEIRALKVGVFFFAYTCFALHTALHSLLGRSSSHETMDSSTVRRLIEIAFIGTRVPRHGGKISIQAARQNKTNRRVAGFS